MNDVYISIAGTIGLVGLIPKILSGANLTENAAKITNFEANSVDEYFIYLFLRSQEGMSQIYSNTVGSTQPKLPLYGIKGIRLCVPNEVILVEFNKITESIYKYKEELFNNSYIIKHIRDTLLPKLLSGEIELPDNLEVTDHVPVS